MPEKGAAKKSSQRTKSVPARASSKRAASVEPGTRPKGSKTSSLGEIDALIQRLRHPLAAEIDALRKLIRGADRRIVEEIKWNAPSYKIDDHFATFNLRKPDSIQIVFHTGAKSKPKALAVDDPTALLQWLAKDRAIVTLRAKDVKARRAPLLALVKQWIAAL